MAENLSSIDYHMQDFIFHQLIQKNQFDDWKKEWKAVVRDLKPFWVYQKSEQILRKKGVFLDEYTERLAKIKNKHQNLFGNVNIDDKFMTMSFKKDAREVASEKATSKALHATFEDETKSVGRAGQRALSKVNEGIKSIVNGEMCVIIMMGEHGEQSIQSNLESYYNLDTVLNEFEKRKSAVFERGGEDSVAEAKPVIREIKAQEIFVNKEALREKNRKEQLFLQNKGNRLVNDEIWNRDRKVAPEDKEELLEKALKEEKRSRRNPLKLLEVYIKRIQRLCNKLLKVG